MDDRISQLPDDLLLKVLSFLPTKVAVSASILSKRWEFLWMWLPKLEYDDSEYSEEERYKLHSFIDLSLPLHKAPVIESLRLNFDVCNRFDPIYSDDIEKWVLTAVSRCVHELSVTLASMHYELAGLLSSLFTCKSLVLLELTGKIFVNVPRMVFLPSLKFLILRRMFYSNAKSLHQLLSHCPVLEDLVVEHNKDDNNTPFTLSYFKILDYVEEYARDDDSNYSYYLDDTPKLEEADIESTYPDINKFVRSIRAVKRLSLCIRVNTEEAFYHEGIVFDQLQHLKLCSCGSNWSKVLVRLLKNSPLLRDLEVYLNDDHTYSRVDAPVSWQNQLDCVPTCLLASLETFKWTVVYGSHEEIDLVKYILRNARCLKAAKILFRPSFCQQEEDKLEMAKQDLSLSFRGSKTCQLVFV
ncbi:hypothetical protein F2Q69_00059909 [Brassica cretica]|uniref:F-box domain-containing protein n=1 Tax=Brassica cretica TaxID=69181 RepID=A0A8S9RNJ2_BRACR|nr:hypothetical protein F2Q69_00059909 [Brassica cretica]